MEALFKGSWGPAHTEVLHTSLAVFNAEKRLAEGGAIATVENVENAKLKQAYLMPHFAKSHKNILKSLHYKEVSNKNL